MNSKQEFKKKLSPLNVCDKSEQVNEITVCISDGLFVQVAAVNNLIITLT